MNTAVCTLFENNYHYGVAALINSLYSNSFRGQVFIGYRGELPPWASAVEKNLTPGWEDVKTLNILDGISIHFIPLNIKSHLAHYKPDFMLGLFEGFAKNTDALFYFDPDIVIRCKWKFYEKWVKYGVTMVEEIGNLYMPPSHPVRRNWDDVIKDINRARTRELNFYINCGFCGVAVENKEFLQVWSETIQMAIKKYNMDPNEFAPADRSDTFWSIDQDAFNIAAMCSKSPISEMGPEAMDFIHGGWTMAHAVGSPKPWVKNFVLSSLKGIPPSLADKAYWSYVNGPIKNYSSFSIRKKRLSILVTSFIGRFYRKH